MINAIKAYTLVLFPVSSESMLAQGILGRAGLAAVKTRVYHRQMFRFKMLLDVSTIPRHVLTEQTLPQAIHVSCHIRIQLCFHIYKIKRTIQ